jgi:hypothetical protein
MKMSGTSKCMELEATGTVDWRADIDTIPIAIRHFNARYT